MVDERDFSILSQLRRDPFSSYEAMGRSIGLSGNAVKARIEAMKDARFLTSLRAVPAAQVFGRTPSLFFFKEPVALEELNASIEVDPVVFATVDVNRSAAALVYSNSPAPGPPEKLVSLLGPVASAVIPLFPYPRRQLSRPVSLAELRVLRALVEDLRVPLKEISESTGLSQKVVKKTRTRLLDQGLLQVQPVFQSARSSRILVFEVHVHSSDDSVLSRIRRTLPRSMFVNQWDKTAVVLSCWAESMAEVSETERRLRGEPGVSDVRVKFHARAILATARLLSWIDDQVLGLEGGTRA